jgi:hypothetical protein
MALTNVRLIFPLDGGPPITREEWDRRRAHVRAVNVWRLVVEGVTREARARAGSSSNGPRSFHELERFG